MQTALRYHQETKYSPETLGQQPPVDWAAQPAPFKEFRSSTRIDLKAHMRWKEGLQPRPDGLTQPNEPGPLSLAKLAALLKHTNGATAMLENGRDKVYFRAAPSAGGLYPTEIYVVTRDVLGIPDGIYNYQIREHALAPLIEGAFWRDLEHWTFHHPAIAKSKCVVLLSAVFRRSSWRYYDRAYRRILLDTGHVLGNLVMFAPEVAMDAVPIAGFHDGGLNSLMLFNEDEEGMLLVVPLLEQGEAPAATSAHPSPPYRAEQLDARGLLLGLHMASGIDVLEPAAPPKKSLAILRKPEGVQPVSLAAAVPDWGGGLSETILTRRSTRRFTERPIPRDDFAKLMAFAYEPWVRGGQSRAPWHFQDPGRLATYVAVANIDGIASGLYAYDPVRSELHPLESGDPRSACSYICLGQDLGTTAGATIFHCVDMPSLLEAYGDRGYRYAGLDAGHVGERLNLMALKLGIGVSGIGGYYDDHVNLLFKLPKQMATVYITCLGMPG